MKTPEQLEAALQAIRAVCREHGVVLLGACGAEGIGGEIEIADAEETARTNGGVLIQANQIHHHYGYPAAWAIGDAP